MKFKYKLGIAAIMAAISGAGFAQSSLNETMRFSLNRNATTARVASLGGAYGAVGADMGGTTINPASLGFYRNSYFTITPTFEQTKSSSTFLGNTGTDSRVIFGVNSLGAVFSSDLTKKYKTDKSWQYVNHALQYNRNQQFGERVLATGNNSGPSLADRFALDAAGISETNLSNQANNPALPYTSSLAYETYLIDPVRDSMQSAYYSRIQGPLNQSQINRRTGSAGEFVYAVSGNYADKFFIGGGIMVKSINYSDENRFIERDYLDTMAYDFSSYTFTQDVDISGTGIGFNFGVIGMPMSWLRLGAAVSSPSFYRLKENYSSRIVSNFDNGDEYTAASKGTNEFRYNYSSPLKATLSTALLYKDKGLISFDYDYVDYTQMNHRSDDDPFWGDALNTQAATSLRSTSNIRIGAELRTGPATLRAGYAMWGSPYGTGNVNADVLAQTDLSFGAGLRKENVFIDLAYVNSKYSNSFTPYSYPGQAPNMVSSDFRRGAVMLTLGTKF